MTDQSWQLRQGNRLIGTLTLEGIDMFWSDCRFEPAPAWEELRPLFATSRDAWRRGDQEAALAGRCPRRRSCDDSGVLSRQLLGSVPPVNVHLIDDLPGGLTRRARSFVGEHGVKVDVRPVESHRQWWLERDIPAAVIDRMAAYQRQWGGLLLPPASQYDGGPKYLDPDSPEADSAGWWFEAGTQRTAVPYSFMISPSGEFGIHADRWAPLHATVEGWVESLALAHHASMWAKQVTKLVGDDVDGIALDGFEPVSEVMGLADTWWRGPDSLVALYTGEATSLDFPRGRIALIYSGLDDWGLRGGVKNIDS